MTVVNPSTPELDTRVADGPSDADNGSAWRRDLTDPGAPGHAAQRELHALLLRATRRQVWRLRRQLPGAGSHDLEDLAQQSADDALVAVLAKLDTFEGRSRFTTWVYKFGVFHAGVAVRRQAWRHREVGLEESLTPTDSAASPAAVAEATDLSRAVEKAIAEDLTPHQRRVALALIIEQVPIDVLAERLGTNRNALYKTLHDARQRLRASLTDGGYLDNKPTRSDP
ncbi:RNA polymerase sigma factor [Microbacterium sp.]|uniref:RNA polymerase sigma factor n=1 Tax=Microbacterium sp. TaxID=51671 RepID=UPI002737101E|nr:sigma-70 family RNA polymerase sigma factor [Microbacterium sp.]MDP3951925.1 sigma-70 family RNA polymerase sigma factor [Microbacterium sp.]